ncbi:MAG: hypothetical protein HOM34_10020 [Planctomycetes bacterium]|nr:hypothetical protein [Planctomycetota bacterium]
MKPKVGKLSLPIKQWKNYDVLIWLDAPEYPNADWVKSLQKYVRQGGSVFMGSCPWGWAQLSGKNIREEHPMNQVTAIMGVVLADGYCDANQDGGYAVSKNQAGKMHAGQILSYYQELGIAAIPVDAPAYYPLVHAVESIPSGDMILLPALLEYASKLENPHAPNPKKPLGIKDGASRLWVALKSRLWKDIPVAKRVAFLGADDFPGAVSASAKQVAEKFTFDATRPGWQSTGLYLAPGKTLRVGKIKSETKPDSKGQTQGWSLRVGCHRDTLWHKSSWPRWPEITVELPLSEGLEIRTPWGGPVYLVASSDAQPLELTLKGAVKAPLFVLGQTTPREWEKAQTAPGPWAEIVGNECVLTVPSSAVRNLADPTQAITFWDGVITSHCELGAEDIPLRKERFVADVLISAGYMHSGYPVMTHLDVAEARDGQMAHVLDVERLRNEGSWGHFHEWGHNRQKSSWTFSGTGEVTCNLFSLHAGEIMSGIEPWENPWLVGQKESAIKYLKKPDFDSWKGNPGIALVVYAMLQREFGWEAYKRVFSKYHELASSQQPKNDEEKRNQFIIFFSQTVRRDLRPLFTRWGWPENDAILNHSALGRLTPYGGDFQWAGYAPPKGRRVTQDWATQDASPQESKRLVEVSAVNEAIDNGVEFLLSTQMADGSWSDYRSSYPNGQTALSVYTLLKCGIPSSHRAIRRGLSYLRRQPPAKTYSLGIQMMAIEASHEESLLPWMKELQALLLDWQQGSGMWSYPSGATDLSITQYAALGLWSADKMGLKTPRKAWQNLAKGLRSYLVDSQNSAKQSAVTGKSSVPARGFSYRPGGTATGSMTAAGVAVAYLCEDALGEKFRGTPKQATRLAREAGLAWLAENFAVDHNPGAAASRHLYYLYGLERACNLHGLEQMANHDWYQEGAAWLLDHQLEAGHWGGTCETSTCFALLFLRRATLEAVTGGERKVGASQRNSKPTESGVVLHLAQGEPLILWVEVPEVASLERVRYMARPKKGGASRLLKEVRIPATIDDLEAFRFSARVNCPEGDWLIYAEIEAFLAVETTTEVEYSKESSNAKFGFIDSIVKRENNLARSMAQASASASAGGHDPSHAIDGQFHTSWQAPVGDKSPRFEIKLNQIMRVSEITFAHARTKLADSGEGQNPRVTKLHLWLGSSRNPIVVDLNPDASEETTVVFSKKKKIRSLRIEVLESTDDAEKLGLGFSEIELQ